jgi:predicted TPR repeat methyltransferase
VQRFLMSSPARLADPLCIRASYRAYAEFYDLTHLRRESWGQMANFIAQFVAPQTRERGARVLDLACGSGLSAQLYLPYAAQIVGVDLSEAMLAHAAARQCYQETHCATVETYLDGCDERFDVIGFYDTFQLQPRFRPLLDRVMRHLAADGLFVFSIPWAKLDGESRFCNGIVIHDRDQALHHVAAAGGEVLAAGLIYSAQATEGEPVYDMDLVIIRKPCLAR